MQACAGTDAEEEISAGAGFEHVGKVLGPHFAHGVAVDQPLAHNLRGHFTGEGRIFGAVDGGGIAPVIVNARFDAIGGGMALDDLIEPLFQKRPHIGFE